MKRIMSVLGCLFAISTANATPVVIGFDDLSAGVVVGGHYSGLGVTFVDALTTSSALPGTSTPTALRHTDTYRPQPSNPIEAIFDSAVDSVSLTGIDVGVAGFVLSAYDDVSGGNLLAYSEVFGTDLGVGQSFTLSVAATGIRRVEFSQAHLDQTDGILFDNFTFEVAQVSPPPPPATPADVPEPISAALFGLGLVGIGASRMRRKSKP